MKRKQSESVPAHEQTNHLAQETRQKMMNWHQSQAGDQMEQEWLAQQRESEARARFVVNFNPCGVE